MNENLQLLSTKEGFNLALSHFKAVTKLITDFQSRNNLADLLNSNLNKEIVKQNQLIPILNIVLVDKFKYFFKSVNLKSIKLENLSSVTTKIKDWDLLDFILVYHHPQLGPVLINPRNKDSWEAIVGGMKENELLVVYVGDFNNQIDAELAEKGINSLIKLFYGEKVTNYSDFNRLTSKYAKKSFQMTEAETTKETTKATIEEEQGAGAQKKKLSPAYGINVSNELFHNGNVEAWKKIIESYHTKYPDIKVLIFYDNEQINDINTLFKWGKVKFGTQILIRIMGKEFTDASKLRRYLHQGASPKFEAFLKGAPGQILSLF